MKTMNRILGTLVVVGVLAALGTAGPKKGATCPACKMSLTTKKDKTHTKAVKIHGKTYYCCAGCKMK